MNEYRISDINIYPIKSLGGFSVESAKVTDRGFQHDRRWMLVDEKNIFLTQRSVKEMSLLQTELSDEYLVVFNKKAPSDKIEIPLDYNPDNLSEAIIWNDTVNVFNYQNEINEWFSNQLKMNCKLVQMPDETKRHVDKEYAKQDEITSLSDGYPFLIIGEESLKLLNSKLETPLPMNRFRPNLVFAGGKPHDEDTWNEFKINDVTFRPVKPCERCLITTVNQDTGEQGAEPLKTLATYRQAENNKVMFGMNLLHKGRGVISVGNKLEIIK